MRALQLCRFYLPSIPSLGLYLRNNYVPTKIFIGELFILHSYWKGTSYNKGFKALWATVWIKKTFLLSDSNYTQKKEEKCYPFVSSFSFFALWKLDLQVLTSLLCRSFSLWFTFICAAFTNSNLKYLVQPYIFLHFHSYQLITANALSRHLKKILILFYMPCVYTCSHKISFL